MTRIANKLSNIQHRIDQLEDYGFRVFLKHEHGKFKLKNSHSGGPARTAKDRTTIKATLSLDLDGSSPSDFEASGITHCSLNDSFDNARGTEIAFGRMMVNLKSQVGQAGMKDIFSN